ncbi:MAG TPA: hypothetical protein DCP64_03115 [Sarcina sp.]|nr:hypothetical protein [Sarcina sp.]
METCKQEIMEIQEADSVMELGVVVGIAAISIMTLIAVLMGIVAAVSTVSGIDTRDNEGD